MSGKLKEISIKEIKDVIREMTITIIDSMRLKSVVSGMIKNQLELYLDDKDNDLDIQIAFFTLIDALKSKNII